MNSRGEILASVRRNLPRVDRPLPDVPLFDESAPTPLLAEFKDNLHRMGGQFLDPPAEGDPLMPVRAKIAGAKIVCSVVPEIVGNRDITSVGKPQDLADVDITIVRASFGVAETGSVLLSDADLRVNAVAYLAQHLIVLLDPADIVVNLHHAYRRAELRDRHYASFHTGPSATADIEGVLIHGAQGARSLSVLPIARATGAPSDGRQKGNHMVKNSPSHVPGSGELVVRHVGVVGLGHMGRAFAVNLVEDGHRVSVYDRDPKRTAEVAGARAATRLSDLADCDVVVTSLPGDDALAAVTLGPEGLAGILAPGAVHVSTSTVSPTISRRVAAEHARHHQDYIAAPVLGNPDFARERKLFVLAGGPHSALEKVRPLLDRLGQRVFVIGEDAALGNLMKLAANVLTATTLECMGEVLALLRKGGIDGHLAYDVLTNSLFDSRVHKTYGGKIVEGRYSPPGMAVPLATKDLRLALAEAEHAAVPMPAASLVHDRLVAMAARGWSELDWSALGLLAAVDAGLNDGR